MSPDPDLHAHHTAHTVMDLDDIELVGRPRLGSSPRSNAGNGHTNGDYQVVANNYLDHDDTDGEEDAYISGEDEGLISNLSLSRDEQSTGVGSTLDDYFYYGFNHAEAAAIDWRCAFWLVVSFLLATCLAVVLPAINNFGKPIVEADGTLLYPNGTTVNASTTTTFNSVSHRVHYDCPVHEAVHEAENYHNTSVEASYINRTAEIETNFTGFLQSYHSKEFDGWGQTYDFVKSGMYHWKSTRFPKNLKEGDTIYESASGIGLNLIMTLEILQEVLGVGDLIVYGNEYIPESARISERIFDALLPGLNATRGSICAADSTNLQHVPANSMDLVFTGYISTLLDPLNIDQGIQENYKHYETVCEGTSWEDKKLKEVAQQRQNDWFGAWVSEMVRIAKPGAPVIVEQVSFPFCDAYFDWGGVNQEFWTDYAIEKYGWEIDPTSIEFEDDRLFQKRYHVFMRKRLLNVTAAGSTVATTETTPSGSAQPVADETNSNNNGGGGSGGRRLRRYLPESSEGVNSKLRE